MLKLRFLFSLSISLILFGYLFAKTNSNVNHPLDNLYQKISANLKLADDRTIYRRLSIQLRGTIPTREEWDRINASKGPIDFEEVAVQFLKSPEFAEYYGIKFGSMFRDKSKGKKIPMGAFQTYLQESIHLNKPYDVLVREMLTSTGDVAKNPATLFYIRDGADPLQVAEYVGRLFDAKRVACARCHDHPFIEGYTKRDYYGLAAFFSQQYYRDGSWEPNRLSTAVPYVPRELETHLPMEDQKLVQEKSSEWHRDNWNKWTDAQRKEYQTKHELKYATLYFEPKLGLRFPHTDTSPGGDLVRPKFLDGNFVTFKPNEDRRVVFAKLLTDPKNVRFRKVFINRIWTDLMGWSFFTPLDDWNDETELKAPEILDHLDQYFLANKFKVKELILYIVSSNAYRRSGISNPKDQDSISHFPPRRLDPDQLLNSFIRSSENQKISSIRERSLGWLLNTFKKPYDLTGVGKLRTVKEEQKDFANAVEVERPAPYHSFLSVFGAGQRMDISDDSDDLTIEQMLTLMNGRVTGRLVWDFAGNESAIKTRFEANKSMLSVIETMYLEYLGRIPSKREIEMINQMMTKPNTTYDRELLQDIYWAILNSQEFLHIH